ncbi:Nesprin-2 KASH domain-containing protein 2 [Takifugu flavidus]|uniref:Nesprin-2 KASH domain-containing protein 2 n=1 Tax=Takifugu flavidus TaxID=433684 RepID=A0A5C6P2Q8_9TELE|nr:Nesprin-2 KASH domain-containing protein 2 [Takifugu flavidus]
MADGVRKLEETLVTVQQLDKNMSNLRTWLSRVEAELAEPVVYEVCHAEEIQRKLTEQQVASSFSLTFHRVSKKETQMRPPARHRAAHGERGVRADAVRPPARDADACGSDSESDSIQQTSRSLDRRWRNICAMSLERRMRIEETWRLWCKFLDDYSRFEDWLSGAELTAADPDSADVLYTGAKEELKKFEAFQRQVHERLTQLELVNKQYRRLARENRMDAASRLKEMVQEGNRRWDNLQRRVASIIRRLRHFTSQREDFEGTREGILVWLTEMDLQLTNVEHFSASDIEDKMRQLNVSPVRPPFTTSCPGLLTPPGGHASCLQGFQQEITLNTNKIDALIVFGENLIQKSAPLDAALIEDELEELHSYCQEVFGRVARFHQRLVNRRPVLEEEQELSDLEESPGVNNGATWRQARKRRRKREEEEVSAAGQQVACHLLAPPLERSGRETPVSVDSIPLEWDHTVDVGGSSHEEDEEAAFFSALSDTKFTQSLASLRRATIRAAIAASVESVGDPPVWHQPGSPLKKGIPPEIHQQGYVKLMSECSGSVNDVKRVKLILNDHEEPEDPGLSCAADTQTGTGVIDRWELLQAQKVERETDAQQRQKLNSDLCDVTSWLGRVLPELERLQSFTPATSIRDFKVNVGKLKEMQKSFTSYKCLMISVNLSGRNFLRGATAPSRASCRTLWPRPIRAGRRPAAAWRAGRGGCTPPSCSVRSEEFHETLHSLVLWLAQAENKLAVAARRRPATPRSVLVEQRDALTALQEELQGRRRQVSSLQDVSSQLLLDAAGDDGVEAKEKVHVVSNRLHLLLRQVNADLQHRLVPNARRGTFASRLRFYRWFCVLQEVGRAEPARPEDEDGATPLQHQEVAARRAAAVGPAPPGREERRDAPPPRSLFSRVLRAAFPLQLVFLVLLVLACLVPLSEDDYSCALSNNFARSFYPMLRYTNGPPPT